jgi:GT2 family glycosyltransferase
MSNVTVVIASRNRAASLARTLRRLAALPERPPVIVVDNGSAEAYGVPHPRVRVIRLRRNLGAVARNLGVAAADTPYVAFADDDSWWAPGALTRAAALFEGFPRLGLLAARTLVGPDERLDPVSALMAEAPLGTSDDLPGPAVLGFLACAAIVRREAFLACGGFDPVVRFMGEEERLAYDLHAAGWGLSYCADTVAHHHPQSGPVDSNKARLAARNRVLTAWMRRPVPVAMAHTRDLVRSARKDPAARAALAGVLARLPRALARRRAPNAAVEEAVGRLSRDLSHFDRV